MSRKPGEDHTCDFAPKLAGKFFGYFIEDWIGAYFERNINSEDQLPAEPKSERVLSPTAFLACIFVQMQIGHTASILLDKDHRTSLMQTRLSAEWLFWLWPDLDKKARTRISPYHQALYLSLGVGQTLLAWATPGTRYWKETMAHEPEHWLPRAFWHLAKTLNHPDTADCHYRSFTKAVAEGHSDSQLPGYAEELAAFRPME